MVNIFTLKDWMAINSYFIFLGSVLLSITSCRPDVVPESDSQYAPIPSSALPEGGSPAQPKSTAEGWLEMEGMLARGNGNGSSVITVMKIDCSPSVAVIHTLPDAL